MTLCVAAITDDEFDPSGSAIVVGADFKVSTGIASADTAQKCTLINDNKWLILMSADDVARARELIKVLSFHLKKVTITKNTAVDILKEAVAIQKHKLLNEFMQTKFGITYDAFLQTSPFTEQTRRDIELNVQRIRLECELLLCTFFDKKPVIFQIEDDGRVCEHAHFGTAGSGTYIAQAALYQRAHTDRFPLPVSLYHVYEAMVLGSIAPGVGQLHQISVVRIGEDGALVREMVTDMGLRYLKRLSRRYGIKAISKIDAPLWEFKSNFLEKAP